MARLFTPFARTALKFEIRDALYHLLCRYEDGATLQPRFLCHYIYLTPPHLHTSQYKCWQEVEGSRHPEVC